jgi:hypothetical protein
MSYAASASAASSRARSTAAAGVSASSTPSIGHVSYPTTPMPALSASAISDSVP